MQFLLGQTRQAAADNWVSVVLAFKDVILAILAAGGVGIGILLQYFLGVRARRRQRREELPGLLISRATQFLAHLTAHMRFNDLIAFYDKGATAVEKAAAENAAAKEAAVRYGKSMLFFQEKSAEQGCAVNAVEADVLNILAELRAIYPKHPHLITAIDDLCQATREFDCDLPFDREWFSTISIEEAQDWLAQRRKKIFKLAKTKIRTPVDSLVALIRNGAKTP